jgi:hypothetical protein
VHVEETEDRRGRKECRLAWGGDVLVGVVLEDVKVVMSFELLLKNLMWNIDRFSFFVILGNIGSWSVFWF